MANKRKTNKKFMCLSALGIIMVVDAHCWGSLMLFTSFIPYNSFFMPMFVFISGYFNKVDRNTSLWEYIKRKSKTLLLPYFCISLIALFIEWLFECMKLESVSPFTLQRLVHSILRVTVSGEISGIASPLWFVPSLFAVQVVYAFLKKFFYTRWNSRIVIIVLCIINVFVVWYAKTGGVNNYNMVFLKVLFFLPFIEMGILYRDELENELKKKNHLLLLLILLLINMVRIMIMPKPYDIAFDYLSILNGFSSPYPTTPLISSVIGILFWLEMVDLFGPSVYENRVVNYISENTFFIMGFHLIFFNLLNLVLFYINKIHPLPGFDVASFQSSTWYRWEHYVQFRLVYFAVGLLGSLALKQLYDRLWRRAERAAISNK